MPLAAAPEALAPELEGYRRQFEQAKEDARQLALALSGRAFNWRPSPGQWSISQCLLHLTSAGQGYLKAIDDSIAGGRAKGLTATGPFRHGLLARWVIRMTEPPVRRRFQAPRQIVPIPDQPVTAVLPTFLHLQDELIQRVQQANGLDLARVKVASPWRKMLRFSLGASFEMIAAHQRRHFWQARQVRSHPNFPADSNA
jgi:hypothetical protein